VIPSRFDARGQPACTMTATPGPGDLAELLRHDQWLRRLARRLVHGRDVDDLVQDAWTAAFAARPETGRPLHSWLVTVLRRLAARRHRTAARRADRGRHRCRAAWTSTARRRSPRCGSS
jgi:DNA-directed RNA polymerase specialized sigma24 family protein